MTHAILAILLASAIAASTKSIVRRLQNNAKGGPCLCYIAAVRRQSSVTAVRARKCIVEFLHDGAPRHVQVRPTHCQSPPSVRGVSAPCMQLNVITLHPAAGMATDAQPPARRA